MKVAALPFNALEGTKPAYGRQISAFAAEQLRAHANAEINSVSFLTQIQEPDGVRMAFVNIGDDLLPYEQLKDLFQQAEVDVVMDGSIKVTDDEIELTTRFSGKDSEEPIALDTQKFGKAEIFQKLHWLIKKLGDVAEIGLPELLSGETMEFGTDDPEAFLGFLEGYDSLNYIQQANGMVAKEFSPEGAIEALVASVSADPDFEGPYHVLVQLARACAHFRIGTPEMLEKALKRLIELVPDEMGAYFGLGEVYASLGDHARSAEWFEKAIQVQPAGQEDPALFTRLGLAQLQSGMPVNAERNFRKAMEKEGDDKPSADYLAGVLQQTGRAHEVPGMWKKIVDANPQNAQAQAKYAVSLYQAGKEAEAEKAFENALDTLEDTTIVKRYYAPLLVQKGDYDRAMDFYEDCIDVAPNDVQLLSEYAGTLEAAGREFEVPPILKSLLASNPDPNTRANALARLIELEQPKRAENVDNARKKMEEGDFAGAIQILKPLRNWLADYWKLWGMLASAYNQTGQFEEAEEAAKRLLELFPGCEPAYGELATALNGKGQTEEAYQMLRYAAANNPSSLPIYVNLGLAAKRSGRPDEAKGLAKQIREAVGPNPELEPVLTEMETD